MNRGMLARALALLLALLLPFGAMGEEGDAPPAEVETEGGAAEAVPEDLGGIDLGALGGDGEPEAEPTAEPTVEPTKAPEGPGWYTSFNYPKDKINFENEIWSTLTRRWGLKDFQAAGLMSSIQAESSFCPYNVQGRGGSDDRGRYEYKAGDSVGFGLCQWTSSGRKAALLRHAENHGSAQLVWDFDIQMGYMGSEIDLGALKSTRDLYEASEWAVMRYERPNQDYANSWPGTRYERAKEIFRNHTGSAYEEPELRFSVRFEGADALGGAPCALKPTGEGRVLGQLVVHSNYYWRLAKMDQTDRDWLEIRCESPYHPGQEEPCACGYAFDGDKRLTLVALRTPPLGATWGSALRFEIYRGDHEAQTATVALTWGLKEEISWLLSADRRAATLGTAAAVLEALRISTSYEPGGMRQ